MIRHISIVFFIFFINLKALSQADTLYQTEDTIIFKALRINSTIVKATTSITKTSIDPLFSTTINLQENLNQAPGVFSLNANNYAQDMRISIRGFGARSPFGIRGVKLIVDGFPETTPDGQGQVDNLNLSLVDEIEVINGPAAYLYGNAAGGVISINTLDSFDGLHGMASVKIGSFGLKKYELGYNTSIGSTNVLLHFNHLTLDGYRDHSAHQSTNIQLKSLSKLSKNHHLNMNISYTNSPVSNDPGGITLEDVEQNREAARAQNILLNSGESIQQYKLGLSSDYKINAALNLNTRGYFSNRQFEGYLPITNSGSILLDRNYGGISSGITYKKIFQNIISTFNVGINLDWQSDARKRYDNNEGLQGELKLDQIENFANVGLYFINKLQFNTLTIDWGLRYDVNNISADDRFLIDGNQSGDLLYKSVNPSFGLNYQMSKTVYLYTGVRTSFETPLLSELSANPTGIGGFNDALSPQKAINYEFGIRHKLGSRLDINCVGFFIKTKNELIPFQIENDERTFFENAGSTQRLGVEFTGTYNFSSNTKVQCSYTFSNFTFDNFINNNNDLKGKSIPGIPRHFYNMVASGNIFQSLQYSIDALYRGSIFVNNDNGVEDDDAFIVGIKLKSRVTWGGKEDSKVAMHPFFSIQNIFGTAYNDNIRINAFGERYYEPAPLQQVLVGLSVLF